MATRSRHNDCATPRCGHGAAAARPSTAPSSDTIRSILVALGSNVAIAAAKLGGALYTGSGALLAECLHSLADCGNQGLLLLGRKQARNAPSARHPLGHGRATYFWSFVVALLFCAGGAFSIPRRPAGSDLRTVLCRNAARS